MIAVKVRKSRKHRRCEQEFAHQRAIRPGDVYGMIAVSPTDCDIGAGKWYEFPVCLGCLQDQTSRQAVLEYFLRDRKGHALVHAIHQRKALSEQEAQDPQQEPSRTQA